VCEDDLELLMEHAQSPYHFGKPATATCRGADTNPLCGDEVEVSLRVSEDTVQEAWFCGSGCNLSRAVASLLIQTIEGKSIHTSEADIRRMIPQNILRLRTNCCLVAARALQTALAAAVLAQASRLLGG
jgi:nitrogen fixation NifU-like protein